MMVLLFKYFHLLWGEGAKILLSQSADEERTENTAIAALDAAVKFQPHVKGFIVGNNSNHLFKGIKGGDRTAHNGLHISSRPLISFS